MSKTVHRIYIFIMASIVVVTTIFLSYKGYSYYSTPMEERFYHPDHANFKAAGLYGHGMGIVGTFMILFGVVMYIVRKRYKFCARWGRLKYWLEFHIFLCSLGPVLILFHTAFKFGGIISIAFWSMVAVVISGVIGRYIYIQIPRSIEGRALSLNEIKASKINIGSILQDTYQLDLASQNNILASIQNTQQGQHKTANIWQGFVEHRKNTFNLKKNLQQNNLSGRDIRQIIRLMKEEVAINKRIDRLQTMQKLFRYWHVAHLPFALVMLIIVVLHVVITLAFGYTWIF